jgi:hypothetical protein
MLLCTLHTEKVITAYHKRVSQKNGYPEVRKSIKYLLDKALHSFTSLSSSQRASAVSEANELMHSKAQLHQGVPEAESLFITASELSLGSPRADLLTAAHVNFAISRNYMAHHDLRDDELAFGEGDKSAPGYILLSSTLTTLVVCLSLISMKAKGN